MLLNSLNTLRIHVWVSHNFMHKETVYIHVATNNIESTLWVGGFLCELINVILWQFEYLLVILWTIIVKLPQDYESQNTKSCTFILLKLSVKASTSLLFPKPFPKHDQSIDINFHRETLMMCFKLESMLGNMADCCLSWIWWY
jgi:hypothetical protein